MKYLNSSMKKKKKKHHFPKKYLLFAIWKKISYFICTYTVIWHLGDLDDIDHIGDIDDTEDII